MHSPPPSREDSATVDDDDVVGHRSNLRQRVFSPLAQNYLAPLLHLSLCWPHKMATHKCDVMISLGVRNWIAEQRVRLDVSICSVTARVCIRWILCSCIRVCLVFGPRCAPLLWATTRTLTFCQACVLPISHTERMGCDRRYKQFLAAKFCGNSVRVKV